MRVSVPVIVISCLMLIGVGMTGVVLRERDEPRPAAPAAGSPIHRGVVTALGRIQPQSEIINLGGASTDVLSDLSVRRGSSVGRGQVIGSFRGYQEAIARERSASQQLLEARANLRAEEVVGEVRVRAAQVQLDGIMAVGPARINAQTSALRSIEIDLANNVDILNARQTLFQTDAGSRRLLTDQRSLVARQRADVDAARARLAEMTEQFAFDRATAGAALAVERATAMRARSLIPVASLEQQVALAQAQIRTASLISPIDGKVLNVMVRPGEAVGAGPILALGDTSVMHAVAEVYETDVRHVRLGQRATVTSLTLSQALTGTVTEIGQMVFKNDVLNVDPAARIDARVVEVRIALDDGNAVAGLTNLTANVAIDVAAGGETVPGGDVAAR